MSKVALITGAGNGMGRDTAILFASHGCNVITADIDEKGLAETERLIAECKPDPGCTMGKVAIRKVDVSSESEVMAMIAFAIEKFGKIDYAVNNAGIEGKMGPIDTITKEDYLRTVNINQVGLFFCLKHEIIQMLKQTGDRCIVNTASIAGVVGFSNAFAYVSSKHAVCGMTKVAAMDYGPKGIRCNAVCPGVIATNMIERFAAASGLKSGAELFPAASLPGLNRQGTSIELARVNYDLCANMTYCNGTILVSDGGWTAQ